MKYYVTCSKEQNDGVLRGMAIAGPFENSGYADRWVSRQNPANFPNPQITVGPDDLGPEWRRNIALWKEGKLGVDAPVAANEPKAKPAYPKSPMYDQTADYLRRLETSNPQRPGMYLTLVHGRTSPDQELDDWGTDGPCLGPLAWCHITYLSTINVCALDDENHEGTGPMLPGDPLHFTNGLLYYDGVYYGDFELEVLP